ncbi:MAG: trigger factor [Eubacterium sp.]|jgi:trigger factor|nr:trigger factor [Eubacterium sp.]MCH4046352.1 trigger factor [Eubacterium sp.]MCH4079447.1 trigger factor [Eubacterium sp.]MCH4111003.1 trigger factor [Eubacterium sp.]MCI1307173.1 trigger factor [Eubacterium sp.]
MKTTLISNENNEAKLTLEFEAAEFDKAVDDAFKKERKNFSIPGFRKGKAPRQIIEAHYGEGIFFQDAIDQLFRDEYPKALDELDLEVIDSPKVDFSEIGHHKPLTMTMEVPLYPVVEVKDYFGLDVDEDKVEVTDEEVNDQIENLRKRNARQVTVDRAAVEGDTVLLDFAGFIGDDQFDGGTAKNQELKLGSHMFIPGFEEQLVGAKADSKVDVNVTFPEDYSVEELAGKEAVFHCDIHEVKEEQLPELNDEFAQDVSEYDTVDELKENTRKDLEESRKKNAENDAKNSMVNQMMEKNPIDVPAVMIEDELDNMVREFEQQLSYQGMNMDMYLKYVHSDMANFRENMKPSAEHRVKSRVLLRSIAAQEGIEASEDEVNKELENVAKQYQMEVEDMKKMLNKSTLRLFGQDVVVQKTVDAMFEKANITEVEPKKPEEKAEEAKAEDSKAEDDAEKNSDAE